MIIRPLVVALALVIAGSAPGADSQPGHLGQLAGKLQAALDRLSKEAAGIVGIAVLDLSTGERFGVNDALVFPQGSAIKIPILIELFHRGDRGELRLSERLPVHSTDQVAGSGLLRYFSDGGSEMSLHDLAVPMIVLSDNTATNILIDRLGMERITQTMASLGAKQTLLRRKMIRPAESVRGNENVSTPREAVDIMARIARCDLPVSATSCRELRRILQIPKGGAFVSPIPAAVPVAWKPGGLEGVDTAWGLVDVPGAPYAIAIMVNYGGDDSSATVREISGAVYRYFTQKGRATPHGTRVPLEYVKEPGGVF